MEEKYIIIDLSDGRYYNDWESSWTVDEWGATWYDTEEEAILAIKNQSRSIYKIEKIYITD